MTRIAYLVTSAREMTLADGTPHPTGYFAEEALKPYQRFVAAGLDVTVITPDGQRADSERLAAGRLATLQAIPGFQHPVALSALSDEELAGFDAVFAPGGHGPMVDLSDNPDVGRLLVALHRKSAPIAALCHGPALLLSAPERPDGQWLFDGYRLTCFTDEEEIQTEPRLLGMEWHLD